VSHMCNPVYRNEKMSWQKKIWNLNSNNCNIFEIDLTRIKTFVHIFSKLYFWKENVLLFYFGKLSVKVKMSTTIQSPLISFLFLKHVFHTQSNFHAYVTNNFKI
jgi:hypothetical protein